VFVFGLSYNGDFEDRAGELGVESQKVGEMLDECLKSIPGAGELFAWFGDWPSFHDAEILSLTLNRNGTSTLRIHTWRMTSQVDERGYYVLEKHVRISFQLREISGLDLEDFNAQNVIDGLDLRRVGDGFQLDLGPCYGLTGSISARDLSIEFEPVSEGEQ
jgi:hypothetical protein